MMPFAHRLRPGFASLLAGSVLASASLPALAQWGSPLDDTAAAAEAPLPAGVRRLADVAYGSDPRQRMDVYMPAVPAATGTRPVLVFVHGGAWMMGDRVRAARLPAKLQHWVVDRGWIVVSVGYRLVPDVPVSGQLQDVAQALARVQQQAATWGGDASRLLLMGHSAGAHLAALLTARPAQAQVPGLRPWRGTVVLDSAVLDLPAVMQRRHWRFYDRVFGADPAMWQSLSPAQQLAGGASPLLLVCSTLRPDDSCADAAAMEHAAKARGVQARVLPQALTHRDINAQLGLPGAYTDAVDAFASSLGLR